MGSTTNVILITGFLGSGKTTFLNRIIKTVPQDLKLMILMNEFGEIGLDGTLVEGDDMDILEISKGSIFCVCVKTDFIKALNDIAQNLKPDLLIVESTGVANPSDLKKDLKLSIFKNRFQLQEQICIIDAACFKDAYEAFASVEKQIESSTLFIINKTDLVDRGTLADVKEIVKGHHPSPEFFETSFSDIPMDRFFSGFEPDRSGPADEAPVSSELLDRTIQDLLENPDANAIPPDRLMSAVYTWTGRDINGFKSIIPRFPKELIRSKGVLSDGNAFYLFNLVMTQNRVEPYTPEKDCTLITNNIVFIGPPEAINALEDLAGDNPELARKSVFDPMQAN